MLPQEKKSGFFLETTMYRGVKTETKPNAHMQSVNIHFNVVKEESSEPSSIVIVGITRCCVAGTVTSNKETHVSYCTSMLLCTHSSQHCDVVFHRQSWTGRPRVGGLFESRVAVD